MDKNFIEIFKKVMKIVEENELKLLYFRDEKELEI